MTRFSLTRCWQRLRTTLLDDPERRGIGAARLSLTLSVFAPIGMLLVCGWMLLDLRRDAWDRGEQTASNLLQVLARDIERNIEIIDYSLTAMSDNLRKPGVMESAPDLRQIILFDRAAMIQDMGALFVLDAKGDMIVANKIHPGRMGNMADRDYFTVQRDEKNAGLYVSPPFVSRLSGDPVLVVSRRITNSDGSFGGVVAGTIKLGYFSHLFRNLNLEANDLVGLYHLSGQRVISEPYNESEIGSSIVASPTYQRFQKLRRGRFVEKAERDGITRHITFARLGNLPLVLDVGIAVDTIESEWRSKALVIGLITLGLCALTIGLSLTLTRELRRRVDAESQVRRVNAELEKLATTDALTELANRRRFDIKLVEEWRESARTGQPLSVLALDADHFKSYNDRYGHQAGDEVLVLLARCIASHSSRPRDLPARIGGEEFAVILPHTDEAGARIVAERIRASIAAQMRPHAENPTGYVTVSCGVASVPHPRIGDAQTLLRHADQWLYAAKAQGRNQVRSEPENDHHSSPQRSAA